MGDLIVRKAVYPDALTGHNSCGHRQVWNEMLEELTDDGFPGELLGGEAAGGGGGESGGRLGHERGFLVSGRSAIRHVGPLRFRVHYCRQPTNQLKTRSTTDKDNRIAQ